MGNTGRLTAGPHRLASLCRAKLRVPYSGRKDLRRRAWGLLLVMARLPADTMLHTETLNSEHPDLDLYATAELLDAFIADQQRAVEGRAGRHPQLEVAAEAALPGCALGRLLYAGAGTSGRLGCWTAWSCRPPSPGRASGRWRCWRAGKARCLKRSKGEDSTLLGAADITALSPGPNDVLIGIAASGSTPHALGAQLPGVRPAR